MARNAVKTQTAAVQPAYQVLPVVGPGAGVDLRSAPTLIEATRARFLVNCSLSEPGVLLSRPGFRQFSSVSLGSGRPQGGARVYLNTATPNVASTNFTLVGWKGGVYNLTDSGGWVSTTPSLKNLSLTNPLIFPSDRDLVAVFDGSTSPWKSTNGSSWTKLGIVAGSAATLSSLSTGGLSSGEYEIGFTYKARGLAFESNGSSVHSTLTLAATSGAINVIIPNSTDPQVDAIVVYARKVSAGETVRRKASSFAQSAGANSTVILTSTAWTTADEEPSDHTPPPVLSFGVVWKNRWWARAASVTNRIYFTQLFLPQAWPGLFYVDIPFERGDAIQALVPFGDTLIVLGTTRIFVIVGQTSLDFEVRPAIASEAGALGPKAVAVIENSVVHAAASGVYAFDGSGDKLLSYDLEPAWADVIGVASATDLARVALVYDQLRKELRISVPRRYPTGTWGEWVLDLNRTRTSEAPAWTATDRTIGDYIAWNGPETAAGNQGRLLTLHSSQAMVFEEAVGTSANGSDLTVEYEGPGLTLGTHRARWIDWRMEYEPHAGACSMEAVIDGVSQGTQSVTLGAGLAVYGTALYGTAVYGGSGRRQAYTLLPLSADGRTYVQKLTYTGQEPFRVFSYHLGVRPEVHSRSFSE